jgi:hypothetical protein
VTEEADKMWALEHGKENVVMAMINARYVPTKDSGKFSTALNQPWVSSDPRQTRKVEVDAEELLEYSCTT